MMATKYLFCAYITSGKAPSALSCVWVPAILKSIATKNTEI